MIVDAFDRRCAVHERDHDLPVLGGVLALHDHDVAVEYAAVDHGVSPDLQGNVIAAPKHLLGHIDGFLDLVHLEGAPGSNRGHQRDGDTPLAETDELQCPLLIGAAPREDPLALEHSYVIEYGADRFEPEVVLDLLVARRNIVGIDVALDELIDPPLFFREIHVYLLYEPKVCR